ncbi:unnamed protein product [Triticum turgidum subsp. durum]|uniref:Uncharacterized protein n=1 Tax=Triticum turgidum subsp. durum TaxID=4567 RepID=A0A9R0YMZ6_TRITD|nr:unnamed protein product [Triticum turgidum subsp. durum]
MAAASLDPPDPLDYMYVRFHYFGYFVRKDGQVDYPGEIQAEMFIPRDMLSYAELCLYTEDLHQVERGHCKGNYTYKLHWLVPGENLSNGLLFLQYNDSVAQVDNAISYGDFADIYVEELEHVGESDLHIMEAIQEHFEQEDTCQRETAYSYEGLVTVDVGETYSGHRGTRVL